MKQIITFCLILSVFSAKAQNFYNLDFEYEAEKDQPRKWFVEEEGERSSVSLTAREFHSGTRSLGMSVTNGQVVVYLALPGQMVSGKTLRVNMHMKFPAIDSLEVMLAMKDPAGTKPYIFPVKKEANKWISVQAEKTFTSYSSDKLLIAVIVGGSGKLFLDDVRLTLDGQNVVDNAPNTKAPDQKTIDVIRSNAVTLIPKEKNGLAAFGKIVGDAKFVALGENSHGSASTYKLKLELIKYLITEKGFRTFALESPVAEADHINDYVMGGEFSRGEILKSLVYPAWKTQEMLDIINWIRSHNLKNQAKVQFLGFDVQGGQGELAEISKLCKLYRPQFVTLVDSLNRMSQNRGSLEIQLKLVEELENNLESFFTDSDFKEPARRLKRYLHAIKQNIMTKLPTAVVDREKGMSEVLKLLITQENGKVIISGDNSHITKAPGKMGSYLREAFGSAYLPVGFTFGEGTYSAYGPTNPYRVHSPYIGSSEYLFQQIGLQTFALDLRLKALDLMSTVPIGFRSIGSRPQESTQFAEITLRSHFDIILYIQESTHTIFPME